MEVKKQLLDVEAALAIKKKELSLFNERFSSLETKLNMSHKQNKSLKVGFSLL